MDDLINFMKIKYNEVFVIDIEKNSIMIVSNIMIFEVLN